MENDANKPRATFAKNSQEDKMVEVKSNVKCVAKLITQKISAILKMSIVTNVQGKGIQHLIVKQKRMTN